MINLPTEDELNRIPGLYKTEKIPLKEKDVYLHFFCGNSDWWVLEYDPKDKLFFGIAKIFEYELGYFSLEEMKEVKAFGVIEIEKDLNFEINKTKDIEELKEWLKQWDE